MFALFTLLCIITEYFNYHKIRNVLIDPINECVEYYGDYQSKMEIL